MTVTPNAYLLFPLYAHNILAVIPRCALREEKRQEKELKTWIHKNDTNRVTKLADESEAWIAEKEAELETAGLLVKPPFSASEISQYIKPLVNEVSYLRHKPKPKTKKKKVAANSTNSTNSTNDTNTTDDATEAPADEAKEETTQETKEETTE